MLGTLPGLCWGLLEGLSTMCRDTPAPMVLPGAERSSCAPVPITQCSGQTDGEMDRYSIPKPPCPTCSKGRRKSHAMARAEWQYCHVTAILAFTWKGRILHPGGAECPNPALQQPPVHRRFSLAAPGVPGGLIITPRILSTISSARMVSYLHSASCYYRLGWQ